MERVMADKRKITLQIPLRVLAAFDEVAKRQLGIGRNAFFSMAALMMLAKLATILGPKKRAAILRDLEADFKAIVEKAGKTL